MKKTFAIVSAIALAILALSSCCNQQKSEVKAKYVFLFIGNRNAGKVDGIQNALTKAGFIAITDQLACEVFGGNIYPAETNPEGLLFFCFLP